VGFILFFLSGVNIQCGMAEALSLFAQVLRQLQWNPQQWLVAG
jgi:hypothetical protein